MVRPEVEILGLVELVNHDDALMGKAIDDTATTLRSEDPEGFRAGVAFMLRAVEVFFAELDASDEALAWVRKKAEGLVKGAGLDG